MSVFLEHMRSDGGKLDPAFKAVVSVVAFENRGVVTDRFISIREVSGNSIFIKWEVIIVRPSCSSFDPYSSC